jgi:site-specific DNA-methyltransferase (adenine-specific)
MIDKFTNKILLGDCLEQFKKIPDNSVDITFADPPFNLNKKYKNNNDKLKLQEYLDWCEQWISEMVRVTKDTGSIFVHNIPKWLTYYSTFLNEHAFFKHWISWDAPTAPMGKTLQPGHYGILFYTKNQKGFKFYEIRYPHKRIRNNTILAKDYGGKKAMLHPFGPLVSDVWTDIHRIKHNKYRDEHPCQLPIHLLERIILMSTDENDIVLDPFNGTGTTAIAAKRLGRKFIGFDISEEYVDITYKKLELEKPVSKLGEKWVSYYLDEVVTLRNDDWDYLKDYFHIPNNVKEVDKERIVLKSKINIHTPFKNNSNQLNDTIMLDLFKSEVEYLRINAK